MKFSDDVGNIRNFQCIRFAIVYIVFLAGDIGPQSCQCVAKSSKIGPQFLGPKFLRGGGHKYFTAVYCRCLPPTVSQSLVEFCGLKCVCEARYGRETQNFRSVGKSDGPVLSRL